MMEEKSGVKFQQAMVALARQWVGQEDSGSPGPKTVSMILPSDTDNTKAAMEGTKNELKTEKFDLPESVDAAAQVIKRFESGAEGLRSDEDVADNVVRHMLHDKTSLFDEKWLGTEEEERNAYVSELLYIHSKVMIVDDRRVIVGLQTVLVRSGEILIDIGRRWAPPI